MPRKPSRWTDDKLKLLAALWPDKSLSAADIAVKLFGSRDAKDAVCGMAWRMDLPTRVLRKNSDYKDADNAEFDRQWYAGEPVWAMAAHWGVSEERIRQRAKIRGLGARNVKPSPQPKFEPITRASECPYRGRRYLDVGVCDGRI